MRYTTVNYLKSCGFKRPLSDDEILRIIENMSRFVNTMTNQIFQPVRKTITNIALEEWSKIISIPDRLPIIEIESINYRIEGHHEIFELLPDSYIVRNRYIELVDYLHTHYLEQELLISLGSDYLRYRFNVSGVFGWIEKKEQPFVTATEEDLVNGQTSLKLASVEELYPKDFINIGNITILIDNVDYQNNTITFDPIQTSKTVSSGTKAISYGKIIPDIEYCTVQLCLASKRIENIGGRILYEKTDRYAYKSSYSVTGIAIVDQILSNYQAPYYVGFV